MPGSHVTGRIFLLCAALVPRLAGGALSLCPCISQVPQRLQSTMYPNSSCMLMHGPTYTGRADEGDYCYPQNYGLGQCQPWDETLPPFCARADGGTRFDAPSWCTDAWCYVDKTNCQLPSSRYDLTPSVVDQSATTDDQLVYSYATCGITSNYAKFRLSAMMSAAEIVPTVANYVAELRDFVEHEAAIIRGTEGVASCTYTDSCQCTDCSLGEGSWRAFDGSYTYRISLNAMTVTHSGLTSTTSRAEKDAQCLARLVEGRFKRIARREYNDPTRLGWFSYGDQRSGVWFGLPGISWCPTSSNPYDPRFRPWYVSAVSGPKDLVIVLDRSNSMSNSNRWSKAVTAAKAVLDTLTQFDYTTVVTFNTAANIFEGRSELVPASQANIALLKTWLDDQYPLGGTNFRAGFTKAFQAVDASTGTSGCNGMVLFLTDGIDGSGLPMDEIKRLNRKSYAIFTYSFGSDADKARPKQIACQNKGIWYHVPDGANIGDVMSRYYTYYVAALSNQKQIRWTMYEEISTSNELITGCLPAYDRSKTPAELLGVVCMDLSIVIGIAEFKQKSDYQQSMTLMRNQASRCFRVDHTEAVLEQLRESSSGPDARCSPVAAGPQASTSRSGKPMGLGASLFASMVGFLHLTSGSAARPL